MENGNFRNENLKLRNPMQISSGIVANVHKSDVRRTNAQSNTSNEWCILHMEPNGVETIHTAFGHANAAQFLENRVPIVGQKSESHNERVTQTF